MRSYQVTVNGQVYTVQIDNPNASPVTVQVNGKIFRVALTERSAGASPAQPMDSDGEVPEPYLPAVTADYVEAASEPEAEYGAPAPRGPAAGLAKVTAPMPGKIMDIVVHIGDRVKHGDALCGLEAMKMKSPIRSTAEGTVEQILVTEGQSVSFGDVLFTLR